MISPLTIVGVVEGPLSPTNIGTGLGVRRALER